MYFTEGFVDKHTYREEGHIWRIILEHRGRWCFVWLVLKEAAKEEKQKVGSLLNQWVCRELSLSLKTHVAGIQKEVNRFGKRLEKGDISPVLCIYFDGNIFLWGTEQGTLAWFQKPLGIYLSPEVVELAEVREAWEHLTKNPLVSPEEKVHFLKKAMLKGMSEGMLENGYFLLWEDKEDV